MSSRNRIRGRMQAVDTGPVCCEPCQGLGYCRPQRNCCLECHFGYEEAVAMRYLPLPLQDRLWREHRWLERNHFPPEQVAAHARWEEAVFRAHCPAWICELLERDHEAHGHGQLVSRVQFPSRRIGTMFSPRWGTSANGHGGAPRWGSAANGGGAMFSPRWESAAFR